MRDSLAGRPIDDFVLIPEVPEEDGEFTNSDAGPARILDNRNTLAAWADVLKDSTIGMEGIAELRAIIDLAEAAGYGSRRIQLSSAVVRGLEYYTGPVFEAELFAQIPNEKGQPVVFGSVGGGGRYDGLVGRFMQRGRAGDRLLDRRVAPAGRALRARQDRRCRRPTARSSSPSWTGARRRLPADGRRLRNAGIAAELYLG